MLQLELCMLPALWHCFAHPMLLCCAVMCCADAVKGAPSKDLKAWRDHPRLALLNLKYDAMPAGELLGPCCFSCLC
jgi:hypothetical protein